MSSYRRAEVKTRSVAEVDHRVGDLRRKRNFAQFRDGQAGLQSKSQAVKAPAHKQHRYADEEMEDEEVMDKRSTRSALKHPKA